MAGILSAVGNIITYLIGGTIGSGSDAVSVSFADSWVGQFASTIVSTPLFLIGFALSLTLFGIHILKSLMGR